MNNVKDLVFIMFTRLLLNFTRNLAKKDKNRFNSKRLILCSVTVCSVENNRYYII